MMSDWKPVSSGEGNRIASDKERYWLFIYLKDTSVECIDRNVFAGLATAFFIAPYKNDFFHRVVKDRHLF